MPASKQATIPRLNRIARGQDPFTPNIANHRAAAHVSQSQKKGAGANFKKRSEATSELRKIDARRNRGQVNWLDSPERVVGNAVFTRDMFQHSSNVGNFHAVTD